MSTAEIIAELPRLSETELALIKAKLLELDGSARTVSQSRQIHSPQLANSDDSRDFVKQVMDLSR